MHALANTSTHYNSDDKHLPRADALRYAARTSVWENVVKPSSTSVCSFTLTHASKCYKRLTRELRRHVVTNGIGEKSRSFLTLVPTTVISSLTSFMNSPTWFSESTPALRHFLHITSIFILLAATLTLLVVLGLELYYHLTEEKCQQAEPDSFADQSSYHPCLPSACSQHQGRRGHKKIK
jgi:hypothetical protein